METVKRRIASTVNTGSMADIAFLLLIFFLVTTTIATDQGLLMRLPPDGDPPQQEMHERNVLNLLVNSEGALLCDGDEIRWQDVSSTVAAFVSNPNQKLYYAESPDKAVVSIQSARGTSYKDYILLLDSVKKGYLDVRANYLGLTLPQYFQLNPQDPIDLAKLQQAKKQYPMQISEAEPVDTEK